MEDVLTAVLIACFVVSYLGIGLRIWRQTAWRNYENTIAQVPYSEDGKKRIKERCFKSTYHLFLGWPIPIFERMIQEANQSINDVVMRPPREARQRIELERQKQKSIEVARNIDMLERSMKVGKYSNNKESNHG